ncbi:MAG: hypothetical protein DMF66_08120, partial [Acidobacteria bacterium]
MSSAVTSSQTTVSVVRRVLPLRLEGFGPEDALDGRARNVFEAEEGVAVALLRVAHREVGDHADDPHARVRLDVAEFGHGAAVELLDLLYEVVERVTRDVEADRRLLAREQLLVRPGLGRLRRDVNLFGGPPVSRSREAEHGDLPAVALAPRARAALKRLVHAGEHARAPTAQRLAFGL